MTDRELRDELVTLLVAGHETTATALAWAFERLVRHPAALERLRAELEPATASTSTPSIKETLRVRPVVADVARKLHARRSSSPATSCRPARSCSPSITGLHRARGPLPDAAGVPPGALPRRDAPGTYTWIPFGGGVRRCLGAAFAQEEMRIVLREIATRADLRPTDPADERPRMRNVTVAPQHEARVVLERVLT